MDSTRITRGRTRAGATTASTAARATSPSKAVKNTSKPNTLSRNTTEKNSYKTLILIKQTLWWSWAANTIFIILVIAYLLLATRNYGVLDDNVAMQYQVLSTTLIHLCTWYSNVGLVLTSQSMFYLVILVPPWRVPDIFRRHVLFLIQIQLQTRYWYLLFLKKCLETNSCYIEIFKWSRMVNSFGKLSKDFLLIEILLVV